MEPNLKEVETYIRKSISEEQLAVAVYIEREQMAKEYADKCRNLGEIELAEKLDTLAYTLRDIASEEEIHIGQFREMLDILGVSDDNEDKGEEEAKEDAERLIDESFVTIAHKLKKYVD